MFDIENIDVRIESVNTNVEYMDILYKPLDAVEVNTIRCY